MLENLKVKKPASFGGLFFAICKSCKSR